MPLGRIHTLHPQLSHTIRDVKKQILDMEGIPPGRYVLVCRGTVPRTYRTLLVSKIWEGSFLHLVPRLRGGGQSINTPPVNFANMSDCGALKKRKFSKRAPDYRIAEPGLCL